MGDFFERSQNLSGAECAEFLGMTENHFYIIARDKLPDEVKNGKRGYNLPLIVKHLRDQTKGTAKAALDNEKLAKMRRERQREEGLTCLVSDVDALFAEAGALVASSIDRTAQAILTALLPHVEMDERDAHDIIVKVVRAERKNLASALKKPSGALNEPGEESRTDDASIS